MPRVQRVQQVALLHLKRLLRAVNSLWKLPCNNSYKEVYRKLLLDGLATGLRLHQAEQQCVCVWCSVPWYVSSFLAMPVAQASLMPDLLKMRLGGMYLLVHWLLRSTYVGQHLVDGGTIGWCA